jgi:hypothetical protein
MCNTHPKVILALLDFGLANLKKYSCRNISGSPDSFSKKPEPIPVLIHFQKNWNRFLPESQEYDIPVIFLSYSWQESSGIRNFFLA